MKIKIIGIIVCMLMSGTIVLPVSGTLIAEEPSQPLSNGNTIYVGGSGPNNYSTIQEGVDAANEGDTVFVYDDSSPYYENVRIEKTINLIGEDKETTVVDGRNGPIYFTVFHISEKDVYISGFTITGGRHGLKIDGVSAIISGNIIKNNSITGVTIYGMPVNRGSATISRNIFIGNGYESGNAHVYLELTFGHKITNNNFINNTGNLFFFKSILNLWYHNYWDRPRLLPKPIFGILSFLPPIPWFQWDLRPALKPNEIP